MTKHKSLEQRLNEIIENDSPQKIELAIHTILIKLDNDIPFTDEIKCEIVCILKSVTGHISDINKYIESLKTKEG